MKQRERPLDGNSSRGHAPTCAASCVADCSRTWARRCSAIEPPSAARRRDGCRPSRRIGGGSLYFAFRNAGKRSVVLDLDSERGRDLLQRLLARADVWIESGRPGALAARGLDPEAVLERHPRLILTSITDFGQTGPYRDFEGTDMVGHALGGMMFRAGAAHRPPVVAPGSQAYDAASVTAAFGILTAVPPARALRSRAVARCVRSGVDGLPGRLVGPHLLQARRLHPPRGGRNVAGLRVPGRLGAGDHHRPAPLASAARVDGGSRGAARSGARGVHQPSADDAGRDRAPDRALPSEIGRCWKWPARRSRAESPPLRSCAPPR